MMIDNIFMAGHIPNLEIKIETINTVRNLTAKIAQDRRVVCSLLLIGDGLLVVQNIGTVIFQLDHSRGTQTRLPCDFKTFA